jgi:hypothetical protein
MATSKGSQLVRGASMAADHLIRADVIERNRYPIQSKHKSLQDAIRAGQYDYVNDHIRPEHFKIEGEIVVDTEALLYHPNCSIDRDSVIKELDQMGLKAATLPELCAFGATYPDIQRDFPVVALGSVYVRRHGLR